VEKETRDEMISRNTFTDPSCSYPKCMLDVFCNTSMIENTPYMARGIYVDAAGKDQNHTFCAIGHNNNQCFSFSIIECVTSILVLNNTSEAQCKQTEQALIAKYGRCTPLHVVNKDAMRKRYKHILWVGQYMVFECIAASALEKAYISFGAGSYFKYTGECLSALGVCEFWRVRLAVCESWMGQIIRNPPPFPKTNTGWPFV